MALLEIDGSFGEGGGQILRTSLALSVITRTPFRIRNIRRSRTKPGLRRQHLTAVRAAAQICAATIDGDAVGSRELTFQPGSVNGGEYHIDVGTAGSTTLVSQTILPALLLAPERSSITLIGGTHNHGGPPWHFLQSVFLPAIARMGAKVRIELQRYGFAPGGEGRWHAVIEPSQLRPAEFHERGTLCAGLVQAIVANLPLSIAEREISIIRGKLRLGEAAETVEATGPGNIVMISGEFEHVTELATGFGQRGVPAEAVATHALDCWSRYEQSGVPVGEHLADQLLVPMALARGGSFRTVEPTLHTRTNAETIAHFLPLRFRFDQEGDGVWMVHTEQ